MSIVNSIPTIFKGVKLFELNEFHDERGSFKEVLNQNILSAIDKNINFVQDNESYSKHGVLRGLHYQESPYQQSKLIRVSLGAIQDVIVDIDKTSETYGRWESYQISSKNNRILFIPEHFAHGFLVLSDEAIINYKVNEYYNKASESGIKYNDKNLNINWELDNSEIIVNKKDMNYPDFIK